jgi:hypothetical protein
MPHHLRISISTHAGQSIASGSIPIDSALPDSARDHFADSLSYINQYARQRFNLQSSVVEGVAPNPAAELAANQITLLGQALGDVLKHVGVTDAEGLTGPELLAMAETFCAVPHAKKTSKTNSKHTNAKPRKPATRKVTAKKSAKKTGKK